MVDTIETDVLVLTGSFTFLAIRNLGLDREPRQIQQGVGEGEHGDAPKYAGRSGYTVRSDLSWIIIRRPVT